MQTFFRRPSRRIALLVAPLLLLAGCAEPVSRGGSTSLYQSMMTPGARLDAEAARDMISLYRTGRGAESVALDPGLMAAAREQAESMAAADKLSHDQHGSLTERLNRAGYAKSAAVENVSAGYDTISEVFSGWRQSPSHNSNMLAPGMRRMGIAAVYNPRSRYKVFWALVLAN